MNETERLLLDIKHLLLDIPSKDLLAERLYFIGNELKTVNNTLVQIHRLLFAIVLGLVFGGITYLSQR